MHDEIELKLALSPEDQKRLRRHPLVRSLARERARSRTLVSTYFDTPERELQARKIALRVRQIGARRVQTLKAPGGSEFNAAKHFLEFDAEIEGEGPDVSLIGDEALVAELTEAGIPERLGPVFTTGFRRYSVPLRFADSEIELALDEGEIVGAANGSAERRMPICEAELELISGRATRLYELALALGERIPFRPERRTKAARGYALFEQEAPTAVKASEVALSADMTTRKAFECAVRSCLQQIAGNEQVVLAGEDRDGVHQLRVGVRRLRALVAAFKEILRPDSLAYLREELSWLQRGLGGAREWDVFIDETLEPLARRLPKFAGLPALDTAARGLREQAYNTAQATLLDPRYVRILLRLELWLLDGGWLEEGAPGDVAPGERRIAEVAAELLDKRDKRLRKLSRRHAKLAEEEMHDIRLLAKKKRYCLEALGSLYAPKPVRQSLGALKAIQDSLGTYNDAVVGRRLLDELETAVGPEAFAHLSQAAAAVRGWQAATMEQDIRTFRGMWAQYESGKRFWRR